MAWLPISLVVPQYVDSNGDPYSGAVLKAYESGTSTNAPFATDSTGGTTATSIALNASGYPAVSGNVVIPHIDQTYKLALYPTQAAADSDTGSLWSIDNLQPISNVQFGNAVNSQSVAYTLVAADLGKVVRFTGSGGITHDLLAVATAGDGFTYMVQNATTGTITIDPSGSEQIDGASTIVLQPSEEAVISCDGSAWYSLLRNTGDINALTEDTTPDGASDYVAIYDSSAGAVKKAKLLQFGWTTGDLKLTFKNSADTGWVLMDDGTIGSASSGATNRANADTEDLFTLFWTNVSDTYAPVSTGRGASAAADFAANKTITLPRQLGRALAIAGAGSGLTSRALGEYLGSETETPTEAKTASHTHPFADNQVYDGAGGTGGYTSGTGVSTSATGGGSALSIMPPASFMNVMVKL